MGMKRKLTYVAQTFQNIMIFAQNSSKIHYFSRIRHVPLHTFKEPYLKIKKYNFTSDDQKVWRLHNLGR